VGYRTTHTAAGDVGKEAARMIPLDLVITSDTDGQRHDLRLIVHDPSTSVRDLATSLGLGPDLVIDGRTVRGDTLLRASGIGLGSVVAGAPNARPVSPVGRVVVHQIGGLSAGGSLHLGVGRYALGAAGPSRGDLRFGAAGSPRLVLTVHDHGRCDVSPGAGEVLVDGVRLARTMAITDEVIDVDGAMFRITPAHAPLARRRADQRGEIGIERLRRPAPVSLDSVRVELPPLPKGRRKLKSDVQEAINRDLSAARDAAIGRVRASQPDLAELRARVGEQSPTVWERHRGDPDELRLTALYGDRTWNPVDPATAAHDKVASLVHLAGRLSAVPLFLDLASVNDLDVVGPRHAVTAVVRRLIIEAATLYGPDLVRVSVASRHLSAWDFVKWLPHSVVPAAHHEVVIVDGVEAPPPTGTNQRHIITVREDADGSVGARLEVDAIGNCTYFDDTADRSVGGTAIGITDSFAIQMARDLAPIRFTERRAGPPMYVTLSDVLELDDPIRRSDAILARWHVTSTATVPFVPLGRAEAGLVELGFTERSNVLVAGGHRSGLSTTLQTITAAIAATLSPSMARIILVDASGDATFDPLRSLPHVQHVSDDQHHHPDDAFRLAVTPFTGHTFIIIDEATLFIAGYEPAAERLAELAARPNVHVIAGSRRPATLLSGAMHESFDARIVLDHHADDTPMLLGITADRRSLAMRPGLAWISRDHDSPVAVQIAAADTDPGTARHALEVLPFALVGRRLPSVRAEAFGPLVIATNEAARRGGWGANVAAAHAALQPDQPPR
jgi:FtsK/SpoIIIE family